MFEEEPNRVWLMVLIEGLQVYTYGATDARAMLKLVTPNHMDNQVRSFYYNGCRIDRYQTVRDVCNFLSSECDNDSQAIQTACEEKLKQLRAEKEKAKGEPQTKRQGHLEPVYNLQADVEKDQLSIMDIFGGWNGE